MLQGEIDYWLDRRGLCNTAELCTFEQREKHKGAGEFICPLPEGFLGLGPRKGVLLGLHIQKKSKELVVIDNTETNQGNSWVLFVGADVTFS